MGTLITTYTWPIVALLGAAAFLAVAAMWLEIQADRARMIDAADAAYVATLPTGFRYEAPARYHGRRRNAASIFAGLRAGCAALADRLNRARDEAWDDAEQERIVADLHQPGGMPQPASEPEPVAEPITETALDTEPAMEAASEPEPEPERHPNPLYRSDMTGWTKANAAALDDFLNGRFTKISDDLDAQLNDWRNGADLWDAINTAGAR